MEYIIFVLLVNLGLSILVAFVASERGRSPAGFLVLSLLASFAVAILILIALPRERSSAITSRIPCPFCDESVSTAARVCPHCRLQIEDELAKQLHLKHQAEIESAQEQAALSRARQINSERRILERRSARKKFLNKAIKNPLIWATLIGISGLSLTIVSISSENAKHKNQTLNNLKLSLGEHCSLASDTIDIVFIDSAELKVNFPQDCLDSIAMAVEAGLIPSANRGIVEVRVYLNDLLSHKADLGTPPISQPSLSYSIPDSVFYQFAAVKGRPATDIEVEIQLTGEFFQSNSSHRAEIPSRNPTLEVEIALVSSDLLCKSVMLRYNSYQVADYISFDWPLEDNDKTISGSAFSALGTFEVSPAQLGQVSNMVCYFDLDPDSVSDDEIVVIESINSGEDSVEITLPVPMK